MSVARILWPNAAQLSREYPPKWMAPNKKYLASLYAEYASLLNFQIGYAEADRCRRVPEPNSVKPLIFTRYEAKPLPRTINKSAFYCTRLDVRLGTFDYVPVAPVDGLTDPNLWVDWHINFADFHLFGFYEGGLFAQDEMQVAEHPILGSVREYLRNSPPSSQNGAIRALPFTRDERGSPTPCLIRNAERRVSVSVEPDPQQGRPFGLYGNNFRMGSQAMIKSASQVLPRPSYSNIIAIEAPKYGHGTYTLSTINDVLITAYTAFVAAKIESKSEFAADGSPAGDQLLCTVHTGHWGTGAYGGNKQLMAMLQIMAARMAGVDRLVFHAFDSEQPVKEAERVLDEQIIGAIGRDLSVSDILNRIEALKYKWGVSDGN